MYKVGCLNNMNLMRHICWFTLRHYLSKCNSSVMSEFTLFSTSLHPSFYGTANILFSKNKQFNHVQNSPPKFSVRRLWDDEENVTEVETEVNTIQFDSFSHKAQSDKQEELLYNKLKLQLQNLKYTRNEDWDSIKITILDIPGFINKENIDAIILHHCCKFSFNLCKSFFTYLKSTQKQVNLAAYGNYLMSFYQWAPILTSNDLKEIFVVYKDLINNYPVLDTNTAQKTVFALCLTEHWKEYNKLFNNIRLIYPPSPSVYSVVIKTCFKNKEANLGWDLLEEMKSYSAVDTVEAFQCWLQYYKSDKDLLRLMEFLRKYNIKPSYELSKMIKSTYESAGISRKGTFSSISNR